MACHPGRLRLGRMASGPGCSTHSGGLSRSAPQRSASQRSRLRLSLLIQDAYLGVAEEFCAAEPNFEALVASGAMAPQLAALLQAAATEARTAGQRATVDVSRVNGEVLFVEAASSPGKGSLQLTGQQGDVMQESAKAALTWIRAHAAELKLAAVDNVPAADGVTNGHKWHLLTPWHAHTRGRKVDDAGRELFLYGVHVGEVVASVHRDRNEAHASRALADGAQPLVGREHVLVLPTLRD